MEILLNNEDLAYIDGQIKKMEFQFAFPLFQFFTAKIQAVQQQNITAAQELEETKEAEAPVKKEKLKKV